MNYDLQLRFLSDVNLEDVYSSFKKAFSDYQMDIRHLTSEKFKNRLLKNRVDFDCSVGVYSDNELVGFTLVGIGDFKNKISAFDAATGIIKEYRGNGLAKKMFEFSLPKLKENGISNFLLEVLQPNLKAIKAYKKVGFNIVREFKCFELILENFSEDCRNYPLSNIREVNIYDVQPLLAQIEWEPSWENSIHGIIKIAENTKIYGAFVNDKIVGLLVFYPMLSWILNIYVKPEFRRNGIGSSILGYFVNSISEDITKIFLHNVEKKETGFQRFLIKKGFTHLIDQFEMELELN